MIETKDINEYMYESLFGVTQKALVLLRRFTIKGTNEQSLLFDNIKDESHEQKRRAKTAYATKDKDFDFLKFFKGVHIENVRKIMRIIKMYIKSQSMKGKYTMVEAEEIIKDLESMLNITMEIKLEEFINKIN